MHHHRQQHRVRKREVVAGQDDPGPVGEQLQAFHQQLNAGQPNQDPNGSVDESERR
jgi:hypothetical protein